MRKATKKFDSNAVQGKGTWVQVKVLTVGEMSSADERIKAEGNLPYSMRMIGEKVVEWNWTDENDSPLPQPKDTPAVLDGLTHEEFQFLCECVVGAGTELKN